MVEVAEIEPCPTRWNRRDPLVLMHKVSGSIWFRRGPSGKRVDAVNSNRPAAHAVSTR
jgi:hypothetical protein